MFLNISRGLLAGDLAAGRQTRCWQPKKALDLGALAIKQHNKWCG
jgi:hypothetical protein